MTSSWFSYPHWYPSPSWARWCTDPMDNCNATGNCRMPTRRFNKIRSFIGSPFTSVLHELGRPTRLSPRMSSRSFPHCAYHFLIQHTLITSAPCASHLSVNFNGANMLCLYKPNHTKNYQRRYQSWGASSPLCWFNNKEFCVLHVQSNTTIFYLLVQ